MSAPASAAAAAPAPGTCVFPLPHKRRPCRMPTAPSSALCGAHLSSARCPSCNTPLRPCSLRPHLLICPAEARQRAASAHPWVLPRCNLPTPPASPPSPPPPLLAHIHRLPAPAAPAPAPPFLPEHPAVRLACADPRASHVRHQPKHFAQHAALCALLLREPPPARVAVLELAAGRAYASLYVAHVLHLRRVPAALVALDRAPGRLKADRAIRRWVRDEHSTVRTFRRLACDVADFCLARVEEIASARDVRVVGKHVCGAALDASLTAVDSFARAERRESGSVTVVLACCCRRLCRWDWLGGVAHVWVEWGLGEKAFEEICRMAQWGLDTKHSEERARVGAMCRLLVDTARVEWLRRQGWDAHVVEYTTASPENFCITAVWRGTPRLPAEPSSAEL